MQKKEKTNTDVLDLDYSFIDKQIKERDAFLDNYFKVYEKQLEDLKELHINLADFDLDINTEIDNIIGDIDLDVKTELDNLDLNLEEIDLGLEDINLYSLDNTIENDQEKPIE